MTVADRRTQRPPHALGLLSGGLDSALAAALLREQGVDVTALHFESPVSCRSDVRAVARDLGLPLVVRAKGEDYLRVLREPRWGYGRNMNPCVDCRIFMFRLAAGEMAALGADFLFTGEVLGQRPMSQLRDRLRTIDRHSGLEGRILRPLSARVLPETEPERMGLVDRSRLLGIQGRSRRVQLREAARLGLARYDSPAGGCRLTDAAFARKIRDLFDHEPAGTVREDDVALLALGRQFRLDPATKVVLGRDEAENRRLAAFANDRRWLVEPQGFSGPTALVCGPRSEASLAGALALVARHARPPGPDARVRVVAGDDVQVRPFVPAAEHPEPGVAL